MSIETDFQQLIDQFGEAAVRQFSIDAYDESAFQPLAKTEPDAIAELTQKLDALAAIISKLVESKAAENASGPQPLAKRNGELSAQDRAAVGALLGGYSA